MSAEPTIRRLVISPHLDDAALSCGGSIHRWTTAGEPVLVVTLVTADPPAGKLSSFAHYQHDSWQLSAIDAYQVRRSEDVCAMSRLGADFLHLGFSDCIYRGGDDGFYYNSDDELFGLVHPADYLLVDLLVERLSGLANLAPDLTVYAPLGVGNHVDHQLSRQAAERWRGSDLIYYEDFPYADSIKEPISLPDCSLQKILLDPSNITARIEAIACYRSQIDMLFGGLENMESSVQRFAGCLAGGKGCAERFWQPLIKEPPVNG